MEKRVRGEWGSLRALRFRRGDEGVMVSGDDKAEVRERVRLLNNGGVKAYIEVESATAVGPRKRGRPTAGGQHMDERRVRRMREDMAAARVRSMGGQDELEEEWEREAWEGIWEGHMPARHAPFGDG